MLRTTGRTDLGDYFRLGPPAEAALGVHLSRTPFLAFVESGTDVEVRIVEKLNELLALPDETKVMSQWSGEWRSDFFQFTVGDARSALEAKYHERMEQEATAKAQAAERRRLARIYGEIR